MLLTAALFSARVCGAGCLQPPTSRYHTQTFSTTYTVTVTTETPHPAALAPASSGGVLAIMRRALPSIWRAAGTVAGSSGTERNRG